VNEVAAAAILAAAAVAGTHGTDGGGMGHQHDVHAFHAVIFPIRIITTLLSYLIKHTICIYSFTTSTQPL
jgi:hypothetical protein